MRTLFRGLVASFLALSSARAGAQAIPNVPWTPVVISGSRQASGPPVTYRAYRTPGERFRIVCQEPCAISEELIFAAYEGFRRVRPEIVALMGVDLVDAFGVYDIHLNGDSWCGPYSAGLTGDAGEYPAWAGVVGVVSCFWDVEKPNRARPFTPSNAVLREDQLLRVHEYGHGLFFRRHESSYEDVVKGLSFYVSGFNGRTITNACDPELLRFSQGRLVYTLCRQGGFSWSDMAPSLLQLDGLYRQGLGNGNPNVSSAPLTTSIAQLREILSARLGRDTTDAFLAAGYAPAQVRGSATLRAAGGSVPFLGGAITLGVPPGAVAGDTPLGLRPVYSVSGQAPDGFNFGLVFELTPGGVPFAKPVRLTVQYEPASLSPLTRERALRLYRYAGGLFQDRGAVTVDPVTHTASAFITEAGVYAFAGPTVASTDAALIVPTVASAPGLAGSLFRTQVQLVHPGGSTWIGRLVFHPREATGGADRSTADFQVNPLTTKTFEDVFATLGTTGSGSLDLVTTSGTPPGVVVRVFNDAGDAGTSGVSEDGLPPEAALRTGERGVILVPPDLVRERLNLGVRTLSGGAVLTVFVRSAAGALVKTVSKTYPATYAKQEAARDFLEGFSLAGNESLEVLVSSGSAFVYGASGDNTTNDPSLQVARSLGRPGRNEGEAQTLPTVASTPGLFGSFFKTRLQLHNPAAAPIAGRLLFHPAGRSAAPDDPSLPFSLAARETKAFADLLPAMGQGGSGSVDVVPNGFDPPPLAVARVFNDAGAAGTSGLLYEALTPFEAFSAGQRALLVAPPSLAAQRMNVGVRTLGRGAKLSIRVFRGTGGLLTGSSVLTKDYPPGFFEQKSLADFLPGLALSGNELIEVWVDGGSLFLYGAIGDNKTNDPTLQLPRRATF